jgi:hypothetical protein
MTWNLQHAWALAAPQPGLSSADVYVRPEDTAELLRLDPFDYVRVRIPPQGIDETVRVLGMTWSMGPSEVTVRLTFMAEPADEAADVITDPPTEAGGAGGIGGSVGGGGGSGTVLPGNVGLTIKLSHNVPTYGPGIDAMPLDTVTREDGMTWDWNARHALAPVDGWYAMHAQTVTDETAANHLRKLTINAGGEVAGSSGLVSSTGWQTWLHADALYWCAAGTPLGVVLEAIGSAIGIQPWYTSFSIALVSGPKGDKGDPGPAGPPTGQTEGTWLPRLITSDDQDVTGGEQWCWGYWRRIGDWVDIQASWLTTKTLSPTGGDVHFALPFPPAGFSSLSLGYYGGLAHLESLNNLAIYVDPSVDGARLSYAAATPGGMALQPVSAASMVPGSHIMFGGTYRAVPA